MEHFGFGLVVRFQWSGITRKEFERAWSDPVLQTATWCKIAIAMKLTYSHGQDHLYGIWYMYLYLVDFLVDRGTVNISYNGFRPYFSSAFAASFWGGYMLVLYVES